jgi:hypothetical protein
MSDDLSAILETTTAEPTSGRPAGEGRSERRVRLSLDVEIDEIDR